MVAVLGVEVDEEQAQPVEPTAWVVRVGVVGAREQQAHLRLERLRRPDLAAPHDEPAAAVVDRSGADARRVGPRIGLGDPERDVQVADRRSREERLLQPVVAELHDRVEAEHREVQRRRSVHRRARRGHAVEHDRALGDAAPATAVLLRDGDTEPAAFGHRGVERPRELVAVVSLGPVGVVEVGAHPVDGVGDREVVVVETEVHATVSPSTPTPDPSEMRSSRRHGREDLHTSAQMN